MKPGGDLYLGPGQKTDGAALLQVGGGVDRPAHQQPRPVWRDREGGFPGREGLQEEGEGRGQTVPTSQLTTAVELRVSPVRMSKMLSPASGLMKASPVSANRVSGRDP